MSSENSRSSLKPGMCFRAWFLAVLLAVQSANTSMSVALAASTAQAKPPLKAIDSSYAKMDPVPKGGIASPNPLGAAVSGNGMPISGNQSSGLPSGGYQQYPYQAQAYGQQGYQPSYPPQNQYQGTPGFAGQTYPAQQQGYPAYAAPNQYGGAPQYGQSPQYGGGYGGAPPVQSPPGYPQMQQQYGNTNQLPPGFVQPGTQQQQQQQQQQPNSFPAGRARLGGGHPNLVPQGAPQSAGPGTTGYAGQGSYPQVNNAQPSYGGYQGGYAPSGYQQPAPGGYGQPPGGYSQPAGYTTGGAMAQQFAQTNFPNPNMIPEFGKPLPTNATNQGAGGMWATNQVYPATAGGAYGGGGYNANPGAGAYGDSGANYGPSGAVGNGPSSGSPEEARVARLEKVAFGSTYPEHEVEDRVDHLEKEIFGEKSTGDMNSRLQRLEVKLGGSSGSYGSPRSYVGTPPVGSPAGNYLANTSKSNGAQSGLNASAGSLSATPASLNASTGSLSATPASLSASAGSLSVSPASRKQPGKTLNSLPAKSSETKSPSTSPASRQSASSNSGQQLALKQPGESPSQNSSPQSETEDNSSDEESTDNSMSEDGDDSSSPQGNTSTSSDQDGDEAGSLQEPSDTTDGISSPATERGKSVLKSKTGSSASTTTATSIANASSSTPSNTFSNTSPNTGSETSSSTEPKTIETASSGKSKNPLKIPFDKGAGDYMERITTFVNNTTAHWTHFPVRVRLPEDSSPEWRKLMEPSVDKWSKFIPLKTAGRQESADIEVSFVNHLVPRVLGVTRLTVASGQMKVFIYMLRPNYYPQLPEKTLSAAFLHELGHAVGIFGHSDRPTDVMYPLEVSSQRSGKLTQDKLGAVSTRDVNTLKRIYDAEPIPADFNLSRPEEWSLLADSEASS